MLKKILLALTAPLRYLIRYEIKRAVLLLRENHDIHAALERRALESTAEYVEKICFQWIRLIHTGHCSRRLYGKQT